MQVISEDRLFRASVVRGALHVFCLGFEDRCLGYPQWLADNIPQAAGQRIVCVDPGDEAVSAYLSHRRQQNKDRLRQLFPAAHFTNLDRAVPTLQGESVPECLCLDMSTLPRRGIFWLVDWLGSLSESRSVFIIHTYPENYEVGPLEAPSESFEVFGDSAGIEARERVGLIVIPGFDREATNLVLCRVRERCDRIAELWWAFPFLKRYSFYERALEVHLDLVQRDKYRLFSQDHIVAAVQQLKFLIEGWDGRVIVAPLGPRVSAVAVAVARRLAKRNGGLTILFPRTAKYDSLRSEGAETPLVEEIGKLLKG